MFHDSLMFYNPKRRHMHNGLLSGVDFETKRQKLNMAGVWDTSGTSVRQLRPLKLVSLENQ